MGVPKTTLLGTRVRWKIRKSGYSGRAGAETSSLKQSNAIRRVDEFVYVIIGT